MKRYHLLQALLILACSFSGAAQATEPPGLSELRFDLTDIASQQCREREWKLAHTNHQIVVCHVPPTERKPKTEIPDARDLIRRSVELRKAAADEALAEGVYAMQHVLDSLAHRSLDTHWRVLINHGIWSCQLKHSLEKKDIVFTDPCTTHRYDAEGRPQGNDFPALAIPPYTLVANQIIIGRLPPNVTAPAIPLPPLDLDAPEGTATDQWVRAAHWGDTQRTARLLANSQAGAAGKSRPSAQTA